MSSSISKLNNIAVTQIMRHAVTFGEQTNDPAAKKTADELARFAAVRETILRTLRSDEPLETLKSRLASMNYVGDMTESCG